MNIRSLTTVLLVSCLTEGLAEVSFIAVSKTQDFAQFSAHVALLDREEEDRNDPLSFEVFAQGMLLMRTTNLSIESNMRNQQNYL